jgi:hypothetical protein
MTMLLSYTNILAGHGTTGARDTEDTPDRIEKPAFAALSLRQPISGSLEFRDQTEPTLSHTGTSRDPIKSEQDI